MISLLNASCLMQEMPWRHPNPSGTYGWMPSPSGFYWNDIFPGGKISWISSRPTHSRNRQNSINKFCKGSTHISSKHDIADKIGPWLLYASVLTGEDLSPTTDYLIKDQDKY